MANVRATFTLRLYGVLPDDDGAADDIFDQWGDAVEQRLNTGAFDHMGIVNESFSLIDGDTEPDE